MMSAVVGYHHCTGSYPADGLTRLSEVGVTQNDSSLLKWWLTCKWVTSLALVRMFKHKHLVKLTNLFTFKLQLVFTV